MLLTKTIVINDKYLNVSSTSRPRHTTPIQVFYQLLEFDEFEKFGFSQTDFFDPRDKSLCPTLAHKTTAHETVS